MSVCAKRAPVHPIVAPLIQGATPEEIRRRLREAGYTLLLVDLGWVRRSAAALPSLAPLRGHARELSALLRALGPPLQADGEGRALYRL